MRDGDKPISLELGEWNRLRLEPDRGQLGQVGIRELGEVERGELTEVVECGAVVGLSRSEAGSVEAQVEEPSLAVGLALAYTLSALDYALFLY